MNDFAAVLCLMEVNDFHSTLSFELPHKGNVTLLWSSGVLRMLINDDV
jgi:hypothetical protein